MDSSTAKLEVRPDTPPPALHGRVAWRVWWLPDLAMVLAAGTLFYVLVLFGGAQQLFRDSDAGWHIRLGERILAGSGWPVVDPFSFSRAGQPWFAWEWGADVAMGGLHQLAGLGGVALGYAVLIATCTWLWVRLNWAAGGSFLLTCLFAMPMLSTVNLHWLARPHVLSWVLFLGCLLHVERRREWRFSAGSLLGAFAVGALWANVHGSFVLALAAAVLLAAGTLLRGVVWAVDPGWARARWLLAASGTLLAGTFVNPYGWNLHLHVFRYLTNSALLERIGEFQSFNFHADGAIWILLMVLVSAVGGVLAIGERRLDVALLTALLFVGAIRSARMLPLLALLALPYANGMLTGALWRAEVRPALRRWLTVSLAYGANLRRFDARFGGYAYVPLLILVGALWMRLPAVAPGFPPGQLPVEAANHLPVNARLLAPDHYGGYLIYRFAGQRPVFFDGRSDFYGLDFMRRYIDLVEVRPGWTRQLEQWKFSHALLPNRYSLIPALEARGWKKIYADRTATILEREN
ncbi:MAG: hypothetical protein K2X03_28915 [Bryobacteraceae bacterium]|nr:hypothetical protein [Bryobacteraceae bacterium]